MHMYVCLSSPYRRSLLDWPSLGWLKYLILLYSIFNSLP